MAAVLPARAEPLERGRVGGEWEVWVRRGVGGVGGKVDRRGGDQSLARERRIESGVRSVKAQVGI